mmetsp:Transcript_19774/g.47360  ORF Transcript_19774/g.47360 Transcript_19774/m.47360 type:complete len:85 (+) Transcript_19774:935-1189(+)
MSAREELCASRYLRWRPAAPRTRRRGMMVSPDDSFRRCILPLESYSVRTPYWLSRDRSKLSIVSFETFGYIFVIIIACMLIPLS